MAELGLPIPPGGLTFQEAGYELRAKAKGVFPGFRCRDCKFSREPDQETGFCTKLQLNINNPRGCCIFYEARSLKEIEFSPYSEDQRATIKALEEGLRKHRTLLEVLVHNSDSQNPK